MVIGTDIRRYAWILSRESTIPDDWRKDFAKKLDTL